MLTLSENLAPHLRPLVANVRGAFDLDAEMIAVDAHLAADPALARDVKREPGVRVPGALDGFETAIRAVLGQQVTVAGARTLTERLVAKFGTALEEAPKAWSARFRMPQRSPMQAPSAIAKIGLPMKRAETLHRLAVATAEGKLPLARGAIAAGRAALAEIPGIGPWTIEYVAHARARRSRRISRDRHRAHQRARAQGRDAGTSEALARLRRYPPVAARREERNVRT